MHTRGLTHRDIKLSNIIFIEGVPKLADIGLVAATGQQSFVGTEGYVPPEGPGTARADIYSLGKLLYETCTGKDRLDFPEIDSELSTRPDRQRLLQLNDVLVKACANDPRKRYGSAAEMHSDLAALDRGDVPRKSAAKILVAAMLLVVLAIAVVGVWRSRSQAIGDLHLRTTIRTEPAGALVILGIAAGQRGIAGEKPGKPEGTEPGPGLPEELAPRPAAELVGALGHGGSLGRRG